VDRRFLFVRNAQLLGGLLVAKTVLTVLHSYGDYFPPNFRADFLLGRQAYFHGAYEAAFYVHILAGPFALLSGLLLLSEAGRRRWPRGHRNLGRIHVACVLLLVVPSGLWMARYAATGNVAAAGFAMLAVATGTCTAMGWRCAMQMQFARHRRWMLRCYALLCSAVVLRLTGGATAVLGLEGNYALAAWFSWLLPLTGVEAFLTRGRPVLPARQ
jgi:Predicted membrane protein (DUF2306)